MEVEPSTWYSSRDTHPSIDPAHWRLTSQPCLCSNHHSTWAHNVMTWLCYSWQYGPVVNDAMPLPSQIMCADSFWENTKNIFAFGFIFWKLNGTGSWHPSSWKDLHILLKHPVISNHGYGLVQNTTLSLSYHFVILIKTQMYKETK